MHNSALATIINLFKASVQNLKVKYSSRFHKYLHTRDVLARYRQSTQSYAYPWGMLWRSTLVWKPLCLCRNPPPPSGGDLCAQSQYQFSLSFQAKLRFATKYFSVNHKILRICIKSENLWHCLRPNVPKFSLFCVNFQYFDAFPMSHTDYYCFKSLFNNHVHFEQIVTFIDENPWIELKTKDSRLKLNWTKTDI